MAYLKRNVTKLDKRKIAEECSHIQGKLKNGSISRLMGLCGNAKGMLFYSSFKSSYPFGGKSQYDIEATNLSLYKNKKRLAFIKRWSNYHEKGKYSE